eukprot:12936790-Prorocentrum_lima.AAC.1
MVGSAVANPVGSPWMDQANGVASRFAAWPSSMQVGGLGLVKHPVVQPSDATGMVQSLRRACTKEFDHVDTKGL